MSAKQFQKITHETIIILSEDNIKVHNKHPKNSISSGQIESDNPFLHIAYIPQQKSRLPANQPLTNVKNTEITGFIDYKYH